MSLRPLLLLSRLVEDSIACCSCRGKKMGSCKEDGPCVYYVSMCILYAIVYTTTHFAYSWQHCKKDSLDDGREDAWAETMQSGPLH